MEQMEMTELLTEWLLKMKRTEMVVLRRQLWIGAPS